MTQEEKARRYDEALERARKCLDEKRDTCFVRPDVIFPELKESEDEKIRKELIQFIKNWKDPNNIGRPHDFPTLTRNVEQCDRYIAWLEKQGELKETPCDKCKKGLPSHSCQDITALGRCAIEKQGEQKPAIDFRAEDWCVSKVDGKIHNIYNSEVGPKFKVGDWITNGDCKCQIAFIDSRYWYSETCVLGDITSIDKTFHLWTIQDAKDGDVLAAADWVFIFRKFHINGFPKCYCHYDLTLDEFKVDTDSYMASGGDIYPATKEQRELLFSKMKDAGYEFDFEKKELKKVHVIDEGKDEMDYCFTKI